MKTLKLIARARQLKLRPVAGVRFRWRWLGGALLVPALCGQVAMAAPRIPVAPVIVWSEDFENPQTPPIGTEGRDLLAYQGADPAGQTYTADPLYRMSANQCNGIVTSFSQAPGSTVMIAACSDHGNWNNLQQMAEVAGRYQGQSAAAARNNHVMAMLTANGTFPAGAIAFRTATNIAQSASSRFLTARTDVVATFCSSAFIAPLLRFSLINDAGTELPISTNAINPCVGGQSFNTTPIGIAGTQTAVAQQVYAAWLWLTAGRERVQALSEALQASQSRREATQVGHEVGHRTTQDLLNAENDTASAHLTLTQARAALLLDSLRLAALAGQLDETVLRAVNALLEPAPAPPATAATGS